MLGEKLLRAATSVAGQLRSANRLYLRLAPAASAPMKGWVQSHSQRDSWPPFDGLPETLFLTLQRILVFRPLGLRDLQQLQYNIQDLPKPYFRWLQMGAVPVEKAVSKLYHSQVLSIGISTFLDEHFQLVQFYLKPSVCLSSHLTLSD